LFKESKNTGLEARLTFFTQQWSRYSLQAACGGLSTTIGAKSSSVFFMASFITSVAQWYAVQENDTTLML
jgi:hypothetical protein